MSEIEEKEPISLEEIDRQYREAYATLLDRIAKRDEMKSLLKIAKPAKIAPLRDVIARFDKIIENVEQELELLTEMRRSRIELDERYEKLAQDMERMKPEFLTYIAENHPEKLAEMESLFGDEDSSKTH
jgi:hypothetical protein